MLHFIHMDIKPLDQMVESYWQGRLNHSFGEDVKNDDPHSPFRIDFGAVLAKEYLKPLLNYFSFDGTGTRLSLAPAKLILDFNDPFDSKTWSYFDKNNYVTANAVNIESFLLTSSAPPYRIYIRLQAAPPRLRTILTLCTESAK